MNESTELVSAVITTHNRLDYLKRAIDSVLTQTYPNIECIVVSDASTDGTDEYCNGRSDIKFISIPKSESHGGNYARNLGIKAAKGKYIAFLDDDDAWLPTKIEKQYQLAEEKKSSLVYCQRIFEYVANGKVYKRVPMKGKSLEGNLKESIFRHHITNTSCIFARKDTLYEIGLYDENLLKWQEYDLMIRLAAVTNIYCVSECLCFYTVNTSDGQRISNDSDRVPKTIKYYKKKYKKSLKELSFKDRVYFEQMCYEELYGRRKYNAKLSARMKYFFPFVTLSIIKALYSPKWIIGVIKRRL